MVRITNRPDMTSAINCGCKATNQTNKTIKSIEYSGDAVAVSV